MRDERRGRGDPRRVHRRAQPEAVSTPSAGDGRGEGRDFLKRSVPRGATGTSSPSSSRSGLPRVMSAPWRWRADGDGPTGRGQPGRKNPARSSAKKTRKPERDRASAESSGPNTTPERSRIVTTRP